MNKIKKIKLTQKIAGIYVKQLLSLNYNYDESLTKYTNEKNIQIDNCSLKELNKILINILSIALPNYIYIFKKDLELLKQNENDNCNNIKLYTDVMRLSHDQGGLLVMECYNFQNYILCDFNGNELSPYCHDLEIGPNGLVVFRRQKINNYDWEVFRYKRSIGLIPLIEKITGEDIYYWGCSNSFDINLLNKKKNLIIKKNKKNTEIIDIVKNKKMFSKKETSNHFLNFIKSTSYDKTSFWFCAPWLSKHYNSNQYLALYGIKKDYRVYNLLNEKNKLNKKIIKHFLNHAPFEYALISINYQKMKSILFYNKNLCYKWLKNSYAVYEIMNEKFKVDEKFITLLVQKHPNFFHLIPKNILSNEKLMLECISINGLILKELPSNLKDNIEFVTCAVIQNYEAFRYASSRLKNTPEIILKMIEINPNTIIYSSDEIKNIKFFHHLNNHYINYNNLEINQDLPF